MWWRWGLKQWGCMKTKFLNVCSLVFGQIVFFWESFATMAAFKLSQVWAICMIGHVSLKFVESWKLFAAQTAGLKIIQISIFWRTFHLIQVQFLSFSYFSRFRIMFCLIKWSWCTAKLCTTALLSDKRWNVTLYRVFKNNGDNVYVENQQILHQFFRNTL